VVRQWRTSDSVGAEDVGEDGGAGGAEIGVQWRHEEDDVTTRVMAAWDWQVRDVVVRQWRHSDVSVTWWQQSGGSATGGYISA